jgi:antibiotic biosynthesis monooxygenase (ABM) superfamily enzyme
MYPPITQLETHHREVEGGLELRRARDRARASSSAPGEAAPPSSPDSGKQAPPRHKLALLTWVGAYAVITLTLEVLGPVMAPWPLPVRTLVLSALMVSLLTWAIVPMLARLFRGWLAAPN